MIRAVVFDLGKVLVHFDWKRNVTAMTQRSAKSYEEILKLVTQSSLALDFELGKISIEIFFKQLHRLVAYEGTVDELQHLWNDIFEPMQKHIDLIEILKPKYSVGLISNTNASHVKWIEERYGFLHRFDVRVYSHEVGLMKPDRVIYELACSKLDVAMPEALFIDDLLVNVEGAKKAGMRAIHLTPETVLIDELRREKILS
ncbi:HAD family phosphatase [bacterium]|nr:HAD family phosphatase [bacterium]